MKEKPIEEEKEKESMEPVMYEGEPYWLTIKGSPVSRNMTFILKKQGLWQCLKCGMVIESRLEKPLKCEGCKRSSKFEKVTKTINPDMWKLPNWKDIPIEELDMKKVYDDMLALVKSCVVFPESIHYKLFVLWIISSWKVENWRSVGFLIFKGPDNSGKTRALELIREMGYRMVHCAWITFPAIRRLTHFHNAGLLIDDMSSKLDRGRKSGREMLDFTENSYRKGAIYIDADEGSKKGMRTYKTFGFKAFTGERNFDAALLSHAIDILMHHDYPEIPKLSYVQDELDRIQTTLLNYRHKTGIPPELGQDFILRGKSREIFEPIISTGMHIGITVDDVIKYALNREGEKEEEFRSTLEWVVLNGIKEIEKNPQYHIGGEHDSLEYVSYGDICKRISGKIGDEGDMQKTHQQIGYTINRLQLKKKRTRKGAIIPINDPKNRRRLDYLYKRYRI